MPSYSVRLCQPDLSQILIDVGERHADLGTALAAAQRAGWTILRKRRPGLSRLRSSLEVTDERGVAVARIMLAEVARELR